MSLTIRTPRFSYERLEADALADLNALGDLEASDPDHARQVADMREQFEAFRDLWVQPTLTMARAGGSSDSAPVIADGRQRFNALGAELPSFAEKMKRNTGMRCRQLNS